MNTRLTPVQILGSDGVWRRAGWSVSGAADDQFTLTVSDAPPGIAAVATRYAYANWPIVTLYDADSGWPAMPWQRWL